MSEMRSYESNGVLFTRASDNIFADLGLPNADELLLKRDLVLAIDRIVRERGWSHEEAANAMHTTPEDVYTLRVGDFDALGFDQLLKMLKALGMKVSVVVTPKNADAVQAPPRCRRTRGAVNGGARCGATNSCNGETKSRRLRHGTAR